MAEHLRQIAEKEGIQAEPSALELIAVKADGGLRDALSMFDLNVTFSTDNVLRHKNVLENLHILDSDYYFKLSDFLIKQDHSESLLLVDEIMQKGFDGHQFISGVMEHFRNLLFAKDPRTFALMDFSDEIKNKYLAQSTEISASFLLSSMNICSQCEIHYKTAKNPRLHIELSILKISYLTSVYQPNNQPVVEDSAGKKSEATTQVVVDTTSLNTTKESLSPEKQVVNKVKQEEKKEPNQVEQVIESIPIKIDSPAPPKPMVNGTGLRSAKKIIDQNGSKQNDSSTIEILSNQENQTFTFEDISREWNQIALEFKQQNFINKFVMMDRPLELIDTILHIKVENEVQFQQFNESIRMELLSTLREKLKNSAVDIALDIMEYQKNEKRSLYTQSDKYDYLVKKYPILIEMKQKFGLDHEF
jgi:DNA polymerase-3 subunit gamma/tau